MAANTKKYKIKISADRTLGPLDFERVQQLVMKGRIHGNEPTSIEPFSSWSEFSAFPELAELLLKKLEADGKKVPEKKSPAKSKEVSSESMATKTMVASSDKNPDGTDKPEPQTGSYGIPTLLNIKVTEKEDNPDTEKTKIHLPSVLPKSNIANVGDDADDGKTRVLDTHNIELALKPFVAPEKTPEEIAWEKQTGIKKILRIGKPINPDDYVTETGKKRILSKNTAALLAIGILAIAYFSSQEPPPKGDTSTLVPRYHKFPYVEVNVPPKIGNVVDTQGAGVLVESGEQIIAGERPYSYINAIKKSFYPAIGKDPGNYDARALLASSYMRISEVFQRNERFFNTVDKLLMPGPPPKMWTPNYVVARAEYYLLLNRHEQAQEIVDNYIRFKVTAELLFTKARIAYERRDLDTALSAVSKTIPGENLKANPRHLLFYAKLMEQKGQRDGASQALKRLIKESPQFGPGLLYYAENLYRNGKNKDAIQVLKNLLNQPHLLERSQLGESFLLTSKILEAQNEFKRALLFAESAEKIYFDKEAVTDVIFRIKSKLKPTQAAYSQILNARQKEKAKQRDLAINYYIQALELNRNDPTPFLLLAKLYEERGDIYEAIDRYKKAKNTPSHPIDATLNLARIYAKRYQLDNGSSNCLKKTSDTSSDSAVDMINQAASMLSKSPERKDYVDYLRGVVEIKKKRMDLAEAYLQKALSYNSRFPDLYIQLGDLETGRNNQKLAEFYYSMALRYDSLNPKAILGVALSRFHLDSPSRAVSFLKDKLTAQPNSAAIMTNLAVIYLRAGDQDSGKNYLQNAIRSDQNYAEAFRLLGNLTKEEGDRQLDNYTARRHSYRYALASYEMYCKLAPNDPEGFKATGDLYFEIRDLGAAAKNYYKVLDLTPNYPDVRLRLAQISRNGGDAARAIEKIEEEICINPRSDAAMVEKGNIFMAKRDFESATTAYTAAARLNEKNADALFGLGVVYHVQGSYDNALSLFARVIKLNPLKADVYWQMGLIYQKQGNKQKAAQAFSNYRGIVNDPEGIKKADDKLKELSK